MNTAQRNTILICTAPIWIWLSPLILVLWFLWFICAAGNSYSRDYESRQRWAEARADRLDIRDREVQIAYVDKLGELAEQERIQKRFEENQKIIEENLKAVEENLAKLADLSTLPETLPDNVVLLDAHRHNASF